MILVIGGRSKIGSELIDLLSGQGQDVHALVRASEGPLAEGVVSAVGDLAEPDSLVRAMTGAEKVFLLSSPHRDAVRWHQNAVDAAGAAGVRLVVRSSILGADTDSDAEFVKAHAVSDRYLENSGLDHVVLRPNLFQQNILESTVPTIDGNGNFYLNAGATRVSMTDTRDVAAVASVVLTQPGHEGAHYDLTGLEALSYAEVAERLSAVMDRPITYVDVPDEAAHAALLGLGLDDWFAGALVGLYQDYRRSGESAYVSRVTDTVERVTGHPARSVNGLLSQLSTEGSG